MNKEPVSIVAIVQALIALGVAFGLKLTTEQVGAIVAVVAIIGALVARQFTWSADSVEKVTNQNIETNNQILASKRGL
jgi:TRAP-type C4-dicarboxylate transport system permease large subunit